jgi:uncharacterized membrane protein YkvA (DUF1232 family)
MSTNKASGAVNGNLLNQWMQAGRLVMDTRVPFSLKLMLPIAAVVYWLWPLDLMPGLPFDDIAVLFFALTLFVKLANDAIEKTTSSAGGYAYGSGQPGTGSASTPNSVTNTGDNNVVDTTWRVIE